MHAAFQSLLPFGIGLGLSALLTPVARVLARELQLLDMPSAHKAHRAPMPLMGGTAVFAAVAVGAVACGLLNERSAGIAIGGTIVFFVGLWDDVRGIAPIVKLAGQTLAAAAAVSLGLVAHVTGVPAVDVAVTFVWLVGLTNSLNLLDNMDGISSGVTGVIATFFFFSFTLFGDAQTGSMALCLSGAALGFLLYNFPPATIFLGDAGSMVYGFVLAGLGVLLANNAAGASDMLAPCALMGLPILDTILVMVARALEGRRISQGGKDHMSHRLATLGAHARAVAWVHYGLAAAFGVAGLAYLTACPPGRALLVIGVVSVGVFVGVVLGRVEIETGGVARPPRMEV